LGRLGERAGRIATMGLPELWERSAQFLLQRRDAMLFHFGHKWQVPLLTTGARQSKFLFSENEVPGILCAVREALPRTAAQIERQAKEICAHKFDLLGYAGLDYGHEIDWHLDAVHAKRAPLLPWFQISLFDSERIGDPKITWELNRHQHLVTLAKAWRLTGDERFASEFVQQWYGWREQNPYPIGINWASSLEVAFRSLSWLWGGALLNGCPALPVSFQDDLLHALGINGAHIESYLSTYSSPNTHLLGEAVALFFIGMLCPQIKCAARWRQRGWNIILEQSQRQVLQDGMHFEQSTYYHVYALDFFLHAKVLAERNAIAIPAFFDDAVQRMLTTLCALCEGGNPTRFGDDDGGRLFDPRRNCAEHLSDPLATGAVLFQRSDLKRVAAHIREETLWLLGAPAIATFDSIPAVSDPSKGIQPFAESGIYLLRSENQRLVLDAGPQGTGNSGHGHADSLSITYAAGGQEWLTDPGTYIYSSSKRDQFRATHAHNTVEIDGFSQAIETGPFAWRSLPRTEANICIEGKQFQLLQAAHNGYERLSEPVQHGRWVFHAQGRFWLVRDVIEGRGKHEIKSLWHCAPGTTLQELSRRAFQLSRPHGHGPILLGCDEEDWVSERFDGWHSPAYGVKEQIPVLQFSSTTDVPTEFAMLLLDADQVSALGNLSLFPHANVREYRYTTAQRKHHIFFRLSELMWKTQLAESDAEFCYCERNHDGSLRYLAACNVSRLDWLGRNAFSAKSRIPWIEWVWVNGRPAVFHAQTPEISIDEALLSEDALAVGAPQESV